MYVNSKDSLSSYESRSAVHESGEEFLIPCSNKELSVHSNTVLRYGLLTQPCFLKTQVRIDSVEGLGMVAVEFTAKANKLPDAGSPRGLHSLEIKLKAVQ
jgi:hypothetical protein